MSRSAQTLSFDVVVIGSSLVDMFMRSPIFAVRRVDGIEQLSFPYGDKISIDTLAVTTGGGASNTAVGFSRQGFNTAVVSELGKDVWASVLVDDFKKERVATTFLIHERKEQTGGSVALIGPDGGRTILVHRGAASQLEPKDIPFEGLEHTSWIHLCSVGGRKETIKSIFASKQKNSEVGLSWGPGSGELALLQSGTLLPEEVFCDVMSLNSQEWSEILKQQEKLLEQVPLIIVTDGKRGGKVFLSGKLEHEYHSHPVNTVDETGAGDAFMVGFITGVMQSRTLVECVEMGTKNAVSVVEFVGAKRGLLFKGQL